MEAGRNTLTKLQTDVTRMSLRDSLDRLPLFASPESLCCYVLAAHNPYVPDRLLLAISNRLLTFLFFSIVDLLASVYNSCIHHVNIPIKFAPYEAFLISCIPPVLLSVRDGRPISDGTGRTQADFVATRLPQTRLHDLHFDNPPSTKVRTLCYQLHYICNNIADHYNVKEY